MKASYAKYTLNFNFTARTSRGSMLQKDTYFLRLTDGDGNVGVGECGLFRGLSADDRPDYEAKLREVCSCINRGDVPDIAEWSSIKFGYETAMLDLAMPGDGLMYQSGFVKGSVNIPINGLIWMDSVENMAQQLERKLAYGFRCIKIKIGQHDFGCELRFIEQLRHRFSPERLEIRLDANGAYDECMAMSVLQRLAPLHIHSVEQPIKAGNQDAMARLCAGSPLPIALDEELIGITGEEAMSVMLDAVKPQYIVLKPTLCGGLSGADKWIELAGQRGIGHWVTSALESNVGLNAIAQWVAVKNPAMCQGLGTGMLYTNNFPSPLYMDGGSLSFDPTVKFDLNAIKWIEVE